MSSIGYKEHLYYLVETEDAFIQKKTNVLFSSNPKQRLLEIKNITPEDQIVFKSSKDGLSYTTTINNFVEIANIKYKFTINPN